MGAPRAIARKLLRAALRLAPPPSREWAQAMLCELEFVESDWPALLWALGCTAAIVRQCLGAWSAQLGRQLFNQLKNLLGINNTRKENKMNATGKKTLGVASGMIIALALGVGMFFLRNPIADMLHAVGIQRSMWSHLLSVLMPTELVLVIAAVLLWKRRAPVSIGILVTCAVMAIHVAVTLASR